MLRTPVMESIHRPEKVLFPYRADVEALINISTTFFIFLLIFLGLHYIDFSGMYYIYPCSNASMSVEDMNLLDAKINATKKEIDSIQTVLNLKINITEELSTKYQTLKDNQKQMEESWNLSKIEYYECYKRNIFNRRYNQPGYFIIGYYIIISIMFTKLFILFKKIKGCELAKIQESAVKTMHIQLMVFWVIHLLASPLLVKVFFYPEDITKEYKNGFPFNDKLQPKVLTFYCAEPYLAPSKRG